MNILNARFANRTNTAVVCLSDTRGSIALDLEINGRNHPEGMAAYQAWLAAGNTPDAFQAEKIA